MDVFTPRTYMPGAFGSQGVRWSDHLKLGVTVVSCQECWKQKLCILQKQEVTVTTEPPEPSLSSPKKQNL